MVRKCVLWDCHNSAKPTAPIHGFPDSDVRADWIQFVEESNGSHIHITQSSGICELHFTARDYRTDLKRKLLHDNAVPSIKTARFDEGHRRVLFLEEKLANLKKRIVEKDSTIKALRCKIRRLESSSTRVLRQQSKIAYGMPATGLRNVTNDATLLNRTANRSTEEMGMASVSTSSLASQKISQQNESQQPTKLDTNDLDTLIFLFNQYDEAWPLGVMTTNTLTFQMSDD